MERVHRSVLLQEVVDGLTIKPTDTVVDGTLGAAGHAQAIAKLLSKDGMLIGLDVSTRALQCGRERLAGARAHVELCEGNFRELPVILARLGIKTVDKVLLDLGWSSDQLEGSGRGFSFLRDEPLVMTLAEQVGEETLTARRIVNEWSPEQIATILDGYGDERFAYRIAFAIAKSRETKPIETTTELVDVIKQAVPRWYQHRKTHPATKTFQALRIAVNDEIEALRDVLSALPEVLAEDGRVAVISFHSIEDRIVKRTFREWQQGGCGEVITKKPITPRDEELLANPRARSAKLRIFKKYGNTNTHQGA
ncbi:16S rRNA (cytosine(1402)-N(4))-methyltransferase [Candidatus Kaiserbacteria bacterium CG10_big_fil_rev_8_21_14_0_10_49_17]|uniref:Ribosomal RNA small subunit methyltransferase H n=1 Tax=Candidatus Kaiserbacteria bacterium CG10_big_fil_rev_8_21_14_0_10_49_17 TaxID=1974609 RepID=A0A2M6WE79_9BACT|nr:MAG: 16S rRNA (cytosine(1402)-N(4))-methyltransferase [Candidatus Kaiserbacteria bacterium CG10_big_fil_rev_8_21_14_0_10_49_17]